MLDVRTIFATTSALVLFMAVGGNAGPLGIDLKTFNPDEAGCKSVAGMDGRYECKASSIPSPAPLFEVYHATWGPGIGLCSIAGVMPNRNGSKITAEYKKAISITLRALVNEYGDKYGAINAPQDILDWKDAVIIWWGKTQYPDLNEIVVNYGSGTMRYTPSTQAYDYALSVSFNKRSPIDCETDARSASYKFRIE